MKVLIPTPLRQYVDKKDAVELSANVAALDLAKWPGPVVRLHLGNGTVEETRVAAGQGNDKTKTSQACEAAFYNGEFELLRQNADAGKALLQQATSICPQNFEEYLGALAELKRVQ